jgi:hypothetical protein
MAYLVKTILFDLMTHSSFLISLGCFSEEPDNSAIGLRVHGFLVLHRGGAELLLERMGVNTCVYDQMIAGVGMRWAYDYFIAIIEKGKMET